MTSPFRLGRACTKTVHGTRKALKPEQTSVKLSSREVLVENQCLGFASGLFLCFLLLPVWGFSRFWTLEWLETLNCLKGCVCDECVSVSWFTLEQSNKPDRQFLLEATLVHYLRWWCVISSNSKTQWAGAKRKDARSNPLDLAADVGILRMLEMPQDWQMFVSHIKPCYWNTWSQISFH